jgi:uroporphyrinogen-III decarboxylase
MVNVIEIGIPIEEVLAREERIAKTKLFEIPDRVAVVPAINYRYLLPAIGVSFRDYYNNPEVMLHSQILGQKWLMENVKTDAYSITGAWVGGWTDFQNATEASAMGCEVVFPDDDIPVVREEGWIRDEKDLIRLEAMDTVNHGLNARQIDFRREMMKIAEKYPVRFQGGPIFYPGENPALTHTSNGPFTNAAYLMGATEAFSAILERPDFMRELLRIIVDKTIAWLDFCWNEEQIESRDFAWTDDLAAYLSAKTWQDVLLPFNQRLRDHFDWASMHMCGHTNHLLEMFTDQLKINEYQGFGWEVDLDKIKDIMGGKVVLLGNVNPLIISNGTPDDVKLATRLVIEKLAPSKGLIIQDGNNIAPGSPVENINAMMEAAEEFGRNLGS